MLSIFRPGNFHAYTHRTHTRTHIHVHVHTGATANGAIKETDAHVKKPSVGYDYGSDMEDDLSEGEDGGGDDPEEYRFEGKFVRIV